MSKNLEVSYLLDFYGDLLTDRQRSAAEYYYNDDLSLSEIADNLNISRQGVRDNIKRAEAFLFNMEQTLGLAKRFDEMQGGLNKIKSAAEEISNYNRELNASKNIEQCVEIILKTVDELCE